MKLVALIVCDVRLPVSCEQSLVVVVKLSHIWLVYAKSILVLCGPMNIELRILA